MRVVMVVPGTGGAFYCENCLRDAALVKALRALGHDVILVPMYLPLVVDEPEISGSIPVFFGGINAYLQQKVPLFRRTPRWLDRLFDARWLLAAVARKAGSTRAHGLGAMTLSMLRGEEGNQAKEVERLVAWLKELGGVDIVHLSNALLLGLARPVRRALAVQVVCSLQDEDTWIDALDQPYGEGCWNAMRERTADVAAFTAVSRFYADRMRSRLAVAPERMHVVYPGIDLAGYTPAPQPAEPPAIGYMARMSESLGLGVLVEAFIRLRGQAAHSRLRLRVTGGMTDDDRAFVAAVKRRLRQADLLQDVDFVESFDQANRIEFLRTLTVLSVPQCQPEALGLYMLESLACGVPVLQPAIGGFPELVNATGGGWLFEPNTPEALAGVLDHVLREPGLVRERGARGRDAVTRQFSIQQAAQHMAEVYATCR